MGIVFAVVFGSVFDQRRSPRLVGEPARHAGSDVQRERGAADLAAALDEAADFGRAGNFRRGQPDARQIGPAIGKLRCRRSEIWLAISSAGNVWRWVMQP